jgi:hypothetical protein
MAGAALDEGAQHVQHIGAVINDENASHDFSLLCGSR